MTNNPRDKGAGKKVRIVALCGSMMPGCRTKVALEVALRGASELEVETQLIELRNYKLVILGQVPPEDYPPDVARLAGELGQADGIIVGTPEYYGSMTGALKNSLDLVGADVFAGKIVGLIGVAGGDSGAINSLNAMRIIGRNLHCWVVPQEVSVANSSKALNEDGTVADESLEKRLLDLGRHVARFTILQQRARQNEFMKLWEGLPRW